MFLYSVLIGILKFYFINMLRVTYIWKTYLNLNASFPMKEISIGISISIGIREKIFEVNLKVSAVTYLNIQHSWNQFFLVTNNLRNSYLTNNTPSICITYMYTDVRSRPLQGVSWACQYSSKCHVSNLFNFIRQCLFLSKIGSINPQ